MFLDMGRAGQTEEGTHHSPVHPRDLYCEETFLPATWNNMDAARVYEEMIQVKPVDSLRGGFTMR
jgi:hypothetical protein